MEHKIFAFVFLLSKIRLASIFNGRKTEQQKQHYQIGSKVISIAIFYGLLIKIFCIYLPPALTYYNDCSDFSYSLANDTFLIFFQVRIDLNKPAIEIGTKKIWP